jgi:hypothetical protein
MMAGVIVSLPRVGVRQCGGCRRLFAVGCMVALDLPVGGWVLACPSCYGGDPVGIWPGLRVRWDGERWCRWDAVKSWEAAD